MTTIPTRLARTTSVAKTWDAVRSRSQHLYRAFYRGAPEVVANYQLDISPAAVRAKIRMEFERHRFVNDLAVANMLLAKGQMEYQETMNMWKQKSHIMRYWAEEEAPLQPQTFLEKFFAGKDEGIRKSIVQDWCT